MINMNVLLFERHTCYEHFSLSKPKLSMCDHSRQCDLLK